MSLIAAVLVACTAAPTPAPPAPAAPDIRFLLVNDVYVGDTLRDGSGGLARVAYIRDSLAREGPLLFVLAGDVLSPSILSKWYSGAQMVEMFNAAHLDFATFGNHEFELDRDTLYKRIADSRFRWTSANCLQANGNPMPGVSRWDTLTLGGTRVGIFGLTIVQAYRSYVRCVNADSVARVVIRELKTAGAQLVVGLTHQSLEADSALLVREPDLDLILGGHEHDRHTLNIGGRVLVKADANSRSAQVVTLRRNGAGVWQQTSSVMEVDRPIPFDPETQRVVNAWEDSAAKRLGPERVIAATAEPIDGRDAASRWRESGLGNLVADAIRLGTGADVALLNSGSMRLDDIIPAGPVTNYQIESIFLFADDTRVVTFPITGARLRELLENGVGRVGQGGYPQLSGVHFSWDAARPAGSKIVGDLRRADGRSIGAAETIRLSFVAYPACQGGDGYVVPEARTVCERWQEGPRTVDLLMRHITRTMNGRIQQPAAGRVTPLHSPLAPAGSP